MKNFVTCNLMGRMGNQMFQVAACIALSKKYNLDYKIPILSYSEPNWPVYFYHFNPLHNEDKNNIQETFNEDANFNYSPIKYNGGNTLLHGFFQSELYFKEYRKDILDAFCMPYNFNKGWVSIHVRRGDYVSHFPTKHPTIGDNYILPAITYFTEKGYSKFMVFSDDIEWCKSYFGSMDKSLQFEYSEGKSPQQDMIDMSCCEHNIIANSTFSWWGAWMNRNENKIVITPSEHNWFGIDNKHLCADYILPENWVRIKY
jgi:hypothetical protein